MQKRQTLAWRRPARALGRVGTPGCTKTVPKGHRTQTDSGAHQRIRSAGDLEIGSCQKKKGVVEWVAREPLVSTEIRAFPGVGRACCIGVSIREYVQTPLEAKRMLVNELEK